MAKAKVKKVVKVKKMVKDEVTGADVEREEDQETEQEVELVNMVRDELDETGAKRTGPLTATVHPDEVNNWLQSPHGWRLAE